MKHSLLYIFILTLVSCGGSKSGSKDEPAAEEALETTQELSSEDAEVVQRLLNRSVLSQKELVLELGHLSSLTNGTLTKLDQLLTVQCVSASGLCYINEKE